jgi:hypothetical protein
VELTPPECFRAAFARRFAFDSPVELALRLSIAARYEWLEAQISANYQIDELFRPLLHAVAAHDFAAAERIAELPPPVIDQPNNRDYALILSALVGLVREDDALLQQATTAMAKRKPLAYVKAIQRALGVVADGSSEKFAEALTKMLAAYPKYMYDDEVYRLVDPHATGLFELCRRYRPELVDTFDVNRGLPWDAGYYEWLTTCDDISCHLDREAVPADIRPQIVDLQPLEWAPAYLAQVKENVKNPPDPRQILRRRGRR